MSCPKVQCILSQLSNQQGKVFSRQLRQDSDWNLLRVRAQHVPALLPALSLHYRVTESYYMPLLGINWVFPPRLFQTLWITILPLRARNHSAHVSKFAPREWLPLLWMSNCLHRTSFALNRRNGEELVKQTESFKLLREWKCMSMLVSLVKSTLV